MHTVKIDLNLCVRCQVCVDSCFVNVLSWDEARGIPYGAYPAECQICTYCERICPVGAIEIVPDWQGRKTPPYLSARQEVKSHV